MRAVLILSILTLTACQENEKSCHDRISADFEELAESASASGNHELAIVALESSLAATVILYDDDRNICDYVTAGPRLQRE